MHVCGTGNGGAIAGAVIGTLAGVALLAAVGYYFYRKNQQKYVCIYMCVYVRVSMCMYVRIIFSFFDLCLRFLLVLCVFECCFSTNTTTTTTSDRPTARTLGAGGLHSSHGEVFFPGLTEEQSEAFRDGVPIDQDFDGG